MSSLLKNLSHTSTRQAELKQERELQAQLVANAAFESELVELHNEVEENLEEMKDVAADLATQTDDVMEQAVTSTTLSDLVDQTIQTYGPAGIDEQGAELLSISVEAVLKASGLDLLTSTLIPSFESGMLRTQYSTEAEEKKQSLMTRMWRWLIEAFKGMWETVSNFFNSFRTNCASVETYIGKVKEKVGKLQPGTEGKEVSAGKNAIYLTDGSGVYKDPATVIKSDMAHYRTFAQRWDSTFADILKIEVGPSIFKMSAEQLSKMNEQIIAAVGSMVGGARPEMKDVQFVNTHALTVAGGPNPLYRMIGAKLTIDETAKQPAGKAPALSLMEMDAGLTTALDAVSAMKQIQTSIDQWLKKAAKIKSFASTAIDTLELVDLSKQNQTVIGVMKTLVAANTVMSSGWSKTVPIFLTAVKANIRYIEMSAATAPEPEMKTFTPAKAIGFDSATSAA